MGIDSKVSWISIPPFLGFKIKWIYLVVLIKNNWIGIIIFIYFILTISSYIYYRWIGRYKCYNMIYDNEDREREMDIDNNNYDIKYLYGNR